MGSELPSSRSRMAAWAAAIGAVAMAALLYLVIPFSQALQGGDYDRWVVREMEVVAIEPPRPPELEEEEEEPEPEPEEEEMPELPEEDFQIEFTQLDVYLNPGMGDAVAIGIQSGAFDLEADTMGAIQDVFDFDELASPPSRINTPRYDYPRQLERQGVREVRLVVEILIDERGRSRFQKILEASHSHSAVEGLARSLANQVRFTVTEIEGRPVKVRARFPITLQSSR